ncbi:MAG: hypothetical protein KF853_11730 [Rhodocyclaceae bacterium]|nr:hypothetical protein [Cryobacterium sp.]MBX3677682.1 hypothetical protein [Rhodocyclaceae bacterium]MCW5595392.1 hypothetical protein [Rhodocyclaceae bacterium]
MPSRPPSIPSERKLAERAWAVGDYGTARTLYRHCVDSAASTIHDGLPTAFYLAEWARLEGTIQNRPAFEALFAEAFALEPNAPLLRLSYARDLWCEFRDTEACLKEVAALEELLASTLWDRANDLSPLAYSQKIETLRAWTRGEPGGPLQP